MLLSNLNTSNVKVKDGKVSESSSAKFDLNTSNVKVKETYNKSLFPRMLFKYI